MESKKIKILHLYHDLMNLYGDWANTAALVHEVNMRGCSAEFNKLSVGDEIDFGQYDFIYIGSGTERSQLACMRDLMKYKKTFLERIEAGMSVLATGNSHELFGQAVIDATGARHEMLGLLDFKTMQLSTRVTGDCICTASFLEDKLIGFINRAGGNQKGDIKRPFHIEPGEGANYKACSEGIRYKNLLGTYMTGPILMRNPPLLKYFTDILVREVDKKGEDAKNNDALSKFQDAAYNKALDNIN